MVPAWRGTRSSTVLRRAGRNVPQVGGVDLFNLGPRVSAAAALHRRAGRRRR